MAKPGDRRVNNGGARPGAGRPRKPIDLSGYDKVAYESNPDSGRIDLVAFCQSIGYDPVVSMAEMALDDKLSAQIRLAAHKEVAKYIHPALGQIKMEHSGRIEGDLSGKSVEDLRRLADELRSTDGA